MHVQTTKDAGHEMTNGSEERNGQGQAPQDAQQPQQHAADASQQQYRPQDTAASLPVIGPDDVRASATGKGKKKGKGGSHAGRGAGGQHRRSKSKRPSRVLPVVVLLVLLAIVGALVFTFGGRFFEQPGTVAEGQEVTVEIPEGANAGQIGGILKEQGIIAYAHEFTDRAAELGQGSSLQSGMYRFTGGTEIDEIIDIIANGKTGYVVTIPEGYTLKQISKAVAKQTEISAKEFYKAASTRADDFEKEFPFLEYAPKSGSMEGFLFPDTYRIELNANVDDVIKMMLTQFQVQIGTVDMEYAQRKNLNVFDVCTLASIIEKESRSENDKADIASVFYNRLHEGINLGSDVTTYYAVGKKMTDTLTQDDLNSDNPYNTRNPYNKGMPPGPICSPGLVALNAAANPTESDYLYFFWSEKEGKTMFYKTLEEFNSAYAKYGE